VVAVTADGPSSDPAPTAGEEGHPTDGSDPSIEKDGGPDGERLDEERESDAEDDAETETDGDGGRINRDRIVTYLRWGALFVLGVVILVAGGGLYSSLGAVIDVWVADRYRPIARAGLNLALLCGAVAGVVAILRRP
jgi:hypothetical protein